MFASQSALLGQEPTINEHAAVEEWMIPIMQCMQAILIIIVRLASDVLLLKSLFIIHSDNADIPSMCIGNIIVTYRGVHHSNPISVLP